MRKLILSLTAATAFAAPMAMAGAAHADVSDNGTTNDGYGYCIANHLANFNGDNHGVGHVRSTETGAQTSAQAGNKAPDYCVTTQGDYAPISNNG
jgi:hypothetical protein